MKRSYLARKTRLKPRGKTAYARRSRDFAYMGWVKGRPCLLASGGECSGFTQAHHAGRRAFGRKAADTTCIPLCAFHHACLHERRGYFADWSAGVVRDWQDAWIGETQRAYQMWCGAALVDGVF